MRVDIITLFPELFVPFVQAGVTRRAYESGQLDVKTWNPRDYAEGNYKRVDDRPCVESRGPSHHLARPPCGLDGCQQHRTRCI